MASKILKMAVVFLFLLSPFHLVRAVESLSVVINEIAWMGTENSANDEWVELYNNSDEDINLEGWGLYEQGGSTLIEPLTGVIKARSYYLIERTDDETVPDVKASQPPSSWGGRGLKNTGEHLQLLDNNSNIVDEVNCADSWLAGDNETKQTMERTKSGTWQTSQNPGGTPGKKNYELRIMDYEDDEPEKTAENGSRATEEKVEKLDEVGSRVAEERNYPTGVVFSEVLPSPEGPDAENEWIEIFNQNNFEVELSGWKIKDKEGKIATYTFPPDTKIPSLEYLVLLRPETKITLNNSGDGLELIYPNGEIRDSVTFGKASLSQSYNKTLSGWSWSSTLTPGAENIANLPKDFPKAAFGKSEKSENGSLTAAIGEKTSKSSHLAGWRGLFALIIAFVIAIFSAIVILVLRRGLRLSSAECPQDKYKNN